MKKNNNIPKIIHYVWLGGSQLSKITLNCIDSWKKYCPDFKIIRWDESNFDFSINLYAKQAFENKKYSFTSDFIKLSVLYKYGGIYLDTDAELLNSFDSLLKDKSFIGFESDSVIGTSIIGCAPHNPHIKKLLEYYKYFKFINFNNEMNITASTFYFTRYFKKIGLITNGHTQIVGGFKIYSKDYFYPTRSSSVDPISKNIICIQHKNDSRKNYGVSIKKLFIKFRNLSFDFIFILFNFFLKNHQKRKYNKKLNTVYAKYRKVINNDDYLKSGLNKKCLIIGNGPSSLNFDYEKFKEFDFISVNQISRNPNFSKIKSKFHFTIDNNFYDDFIRVTSGNDFLNIYKKVGENNPKVIYFFPFDARNSRLINELEKNFKIRYFIPTNMIDYNNFNSNDSFLLVPVYKSVVLIAIHFAIYCGYKEIYLIGCEETNIEMFLNAKLKKLKQLQYGYPKDKEETKRINDYFKDSKMSFKLNEYSILFKQFEILKNVCDIKGIKLFNLTKESLIDSIPYLDINKLK